MKEISLQERINEFKNITSYRLIQGLPIIISVSFIRNGKEEIKDIDIINSAQITGKVVGATTIVICNKFDLIIPPVKRWGDMIGEGYISRIGSIIGSISSKNINGYALVDCWNVPGDREVYKFVNLKITEKCLILRRTERLAPLSKEEIDLLPEKHAARKNNNLPIQKTIYQKLETDPKAEESFLYPWKEIFDGNKIIRES